MHRFRLKYGATVRVQEAQWDDVARLRVMFFGLSAETRYWYFGVGAPATDHWADRLAALGTPAPEAFALVAEAPLGIIGVARFVVDGTGRYAEIGLVLTDAWQSQGLGTQMLLCLCDIAQKRALEGFSAHVMGENRRALRLVRRICAAAQFTFASGDFDVRMPFATAA
jgi:RimJ/RimL family protein N-acetyltransferase